MTCIIKKRWLEST